MVCPRSMVVKYKLRLVTYVCEELLQQASTLDTAKGHLQRAVNALEGQGGPHYKVDKNVGNPCYGMPGQGVIQDLGGDEVQTLFGAQRATTARQMAEQACAAAVARIADPRITIDAIKRPADLLSSLQAAAKALMP